jgi:hypothetical protein
MTRSGLTIAIATVTFIGAHNVRAADLPISRHRQPAAGINAAPTEVIRSNRRHVVVVHRYRIVRKSIGMLCVLPPQAIVQLKWNGPQCRWVDNII